MKKATYHSPWIETWYKLGKQNPWIAQAYDPPFTLDSFTYSRCVSIEELREKFERGNWCVGTAFYFNDICFINQVEGGGEWLVIRKDIVFESLTGSHYGECLGRLQNFIERVEAGTDQQLKELRY